MLRKLDTTVFKQMAQIEDRHWWCRARREILATAIERFSTRSAASRIRLAEVGCGSGGNLPMLATFGRVLGTEPDVATVDYLRRTRGEAFEVICQPVPAPLPGKFHVIAMFDVLEHIEDDRGALAWVSDHLEPGGIVVLSVPAFRFLWTEQDEAAHHFRRYTPDELVNVVPESLTIEHVSCFNTLLFPAILAVRTAMQLRRRKNRPPKTHLGIPPEPFNWLFYRIFRLERHFVCRLRFNLGVSILLVARRRLAPA